jgi:hypothetical protein
MENSFTKASELSVDELRMLAKEIRVISNADAPANVKQSPLMKELFDLEKRDWGYWSDQFSRVRLAIEIEIISRFTNDKL